jgi:hypothetical protein
MIWGKKEGAVYVGFCDEPISVKELIARFSHAAKQLSDSDEPLNHLPSHGALKAGYVTDFLLCMLGHSKLSCLNVLLSWGVVFEEITRYSIQVLSVRHSFVLYVCRLPAAI